MASATPLHPHRAATQGVMAFADVRNSGTEAYLAARRDRPPSPNSTSHMCRATFHAPLSSN
jgi:hypothetical protein